MEYVPRSSFSRKSIIERRLEKLVGKKKKERRCKRPTDPEGNDKYWEKFDKGGYQITTKEGAHAPKNIARGGDVVVSAEKERNRGVPMVAKKRRKKTPW